jgi:hypothetical protein
MVATMSQAYRVDWVMETRLQQAFYDLAELISEGIVTYEGAHKHLRIAYSVEIADWFKEWWDEVDL